MKRLEKMIEELKILLKTNNDDENENFNILTTDYPIEVAGNITSIKVPNKINKEQNKQDKELK